jgi:hypothetical protein
MVEKLTFSIYLETYFPLLWSVIVSVYEFADNHFVRLHHMSIMDKTVELLMLVRFRIVSTLAFLVFACLSHYFNHGTHDYIYFWLLLLMDYLFLLDTVVIDVLARTVGFAVFDAITFVVCILFCLLSQEEKDRQFPKFNIIVVSVYVCRIAGFLCYHHYLKVSCSYYEKQISDNSIVKELTRAE